MIKLGLLLLLSSSVHAYSFKDIDLSSYEFNRYVRPQLISITQDYQSLFTQINPEVTPLKPLFNVYRELIAQNKDLKKYCLKSEINLDCQNTLEKMMAQMSKGLKVINNSIELSDKKHFTAEHMMDALEAQSKFLLEYNDLQLRIENLYFLYLAQTDQSTNFKRLMSDIERSYTFFNDFLLKASDPRFRTEFVAFWSDFIKPVSLIVLPQNSQDIFVQKINDFNLRLNFLNVVLTKRNLPINKQAKTLVKMLHNRWNNILKISLKRHR